MKIRSFRKRLNKGFTLVELLVVVLILAILMSVALPTYLSATNNATKRACQANMQTISNAVYSNKVTLRASDFSGFIGAVSTASAYEPDLGSIPTCPNGGTYTIKQQTSGDNSTFKVNCTKEGDYIPGVVPS